MKHNHIGTVIKEFRAQRNMSRNELAKDICSEKYIYLIEKGERTPSTSSLRQFGDELKVDIFGYYKFLDCRDPVKVREIIDRLTECQKNSDYVETERIVKIAEKMPDFDCNPWIHILEANQIACDIFNRKKHEESIVNIDAALEKVESRHIDSMFVLSLYVLLSTCYQVLGKKDEANTVILKIKDIIKDKYDNPTDNHMTITGRITVLAYYFHIKEFDQAISVGEGLVQFQKTIDALSRTQYSYAFLAYSYYQVGNYDRAFSYFSKTIFTLMTDCTPNDIHYIMSIDLFDTMAKDERMNQDVMKLFFDMYKEII